jgi:hypothetical protein
MMASILMDESGLRIKYETGMYKVGWENSIKEMREFVAEREMRMSSSCVRKGKFQIS